MMHFSVFVNNAKIVIFFEFHGPCILIVKCIFLINFEQYFSFWVLFQVWVPHLVKVGAFEALLRRPTEIGIELK